MRLDISSLCVMDGFGGLLLKVEWQLISSVGATLVSVAALGVSILNYLRTNPRSRIQVTVSHWAKFAVPQISVTIANDGTVPITVQQIHLVSQIVRSKRRIFHCVADSIQDPISPGSIRTFDYRGSDYLFYDTVRVTLHDGSQSDHSFDSKASDALEWINYLRERLECIGYSGFKETTHLVLMETKRRVLYEADLLLPHYDDGDLEVFSGRSEIGGEAADKFRTWCSMCPELFTFEESRRAFIRPYWTYEASAAARDSSKLAALREVASKKDRDETIDVSSLQAKPQLSPCVESEPASQRAITGS